MMESFSLGRGTIFTFFLSFTLIYTLYCLKKFQTRIQLSKRAIEHRLSRDLRLVLTTCSEAVTGLPPLRTDSNSSGNPC